MLIIYNIVRWETKSDWWKSVCFSLPKNFLRAACYMLLITVREKKAEWEHEGKWKAHTLSYPEKFVCASSWLCALAISSLSLFYVSLFQLFYPTGEFTVKIHKRTYFSQQIFPYINVLTPVFQYSTSMYVYTFKFQWQFIFKAGRGKKSNVLLNALQSLKLLKFSYFISMCHKPKLRFFFK